MAITAIARRVFFRSTVCQGVYGVERLGNEKSLIGLKFADAPTRNGALHLLHFTRPRDTYLSLAPHNSGTNHPTTRK